MTPALLLLTALAVFGTAPATIWPSEYVEALQQQAATTAPAPPSSIELGDFWVAERICVPTPGRFNRWMCSGRGWVIPPLIPGAETTYLSAPAQIHYVRQGEKVLGIVVQLYPIHDTYGDTKTIARQLEGAEQCTSRDGDLRLFRTNVGYARRIQAPVNGLLLVVPALVREVIPDSTSDSPMPGSHTGCFL